VKTIDIICVGEVVIDFIGHEINTSINKTKDYHRFLGGSPTNVAVNASRIGLKPILVASCGQDGLGDYIVKKLKSNNLDVSYIKKINDLPTSIILVSKSTETPDFIPYRQADCDITIDQLPDEMIQNARIFHTTCFALSKDPARQTILNRAKRAKEFGLKLSIDLNYSERIWPNREDAKKVIKDYLKNDPLLKISEDDCFRFFEEVKSENFIFDYFHNLGVTTICLTKGKKGVVVSDIHEGLFFQEAEFIQEVKDTTGAGDAFWTGFLYAQIKNKNIKNSISIAQKLASLKLQSVGKLPENIDLESLFNLI
jgi:fructokinase